MLDTLISIELLLTSFVDCRGSLGFGEEALQSLPGNVGSQVPVYHSSSNITHQFNYLTLGIHFLASRM